MTDEELFKEYNTHPVAWIKKHNGGGVKRNTLKLMELAREQERKLVQSKFSNQVTDNY